LVDVPLSEISAVLNDGMSHSSSLLGVQTVFEDARRGDSPMDGSDAITLFPESITGTGQSKRHSIIRMPLDVGDLIAMCRSRIGRGRTVCLSKNCNINHQGGLVAVKPGDFVVVKTIGRVAFESPRTSSSTLDDSVIGEWIAAQDTLTSWTNKFAQASEVQESGEIVDLKNLELRMEEELKAATFKTPRAKRGLLSSKTTPIGIGISPYTKTLSGEESFANISDAISLDKMKDVILKLDSGLEELSAYSVMLGQDVEKLVSASATSFQMLERKLLLAARSIGDRAEDLASDLDSPTVWGALAAINLRVEEVRAEANRYVNSAPPRVDPWLAVRVQKVESDLLATVTHLSQAINGLGARLDMAAPSQAPAVMPSVQESATLDSGFMMNIQACVNTMSGQINNLRTDCQSTTIKFAGLGFDSIHKASAWLSINISTVDAGLIVDPHTVFEHIFAEANGDDFFKSFERVDKLQILTLQQGYAMTSFQQAVPKFFSSSGTRVVRDHESFFSKITTSAEWGHQHTGFRDTLRAGLTAFATSHREAIDTTFGDEPTSNAYAVAIVSLNESVSIIEAWIAFVDDYVKSLTIAKFNHKKAFHVTTMLARRLLIAIFEPRAGVLKTFKAGDMEQTGRAVFWATLRSLDIALKMKRSVGFF
jgi:hypothetical protein